MISYLVLQMSSLLIIAAFLIMRSDDCTARPHVLRNSQKLINLNYRSTSPLLVHSQRRYQHSGLTVKGSSSTSLFALGEEKGNKLSPLVPPFGVKLSPFVSKDFFGTPMSAIPLKESMAIIFLQHELRLSEKTLMNVIVNHSSLMYLRVDTNLRPTMAVFRSFGFKDKDIRSMVEQAPSVLAINHEWTLPEKLISLQSMFNLNKNNLVKVVVSQPFLLTSSIERNLEISGVKNNCMPL